MNDDISSEFEFSAENHEAKRRRLDFATTSESSRFQGVSSKSGNQSEWDREYRKDKIFKMDAYSRHKFLVNEYLLNHPGSTKILKRDASRDKTDLDVIKINHKFLWDDDDEVFMDWGRRLAQKYYDKLFKEYCIADLSRYKENKVAMRWRIEQEVVIGKGQFICGNKKCEEKTDLTSWEVNFAYLENETKKNALVKLRLCPGCSTKLNYRHQRRKVVKKPKKSQKMLEKSEIKLEPDPEEQDQVLKNNADEKSTIPTTVPVKEIWSKPVEVEEEKNREDEFQEFLEEMFM